MEEILKFLPLDEKYEEIILFIWRIIKCTGVFIIIFTVIKLVCSKLFGKIIQKIETGERQRQFLTLKAIIYHTLQGINVALYAMNILYLFGIDVRPIIATAGVLGIAIGFGSKRLVEDILSGIMILLQGQIRVGDYVQIDGASGFVEKITLPLITIRSVDSGAVSFIRCGCIDTVKNFTIAFSYAFFPFEVAYKENVDIVCASIKQAFKTLKNNPEYSPLILDDIEIFGLDEFKESSLLIKCRIKTQPKGQWTIKRAFNKIIKEQFEKDNIEIPFNQLVVTNV